MIRFANMILTLSILSSLRSWLGRGDRRLHGNRLRLAFGARWIIKVSLKQRNQFLTERFLVRTGHLDYEGCPLVQAQRQKTHHRTQIGLARVRSNTDDAGVVHRFLDNDRRWAAMNASGISYNGMDLNHAVIFKFQVSSFKLNLCGLLRYKPP